MANHRAENRVSIWGYFGYGRPLSGFIFAILMCIILAVVGIPYLSALFGLISLGFLYGIYKSCQTPGREGLNVRRRIGVLVTSPGGSSNQNVSGTDNPIFLELTATALARNHSAVPGHYSVGSFPSRPNDLRHDDQPPDYFEIISSTKVYPESPSARGDLSPSSSESISPGLVTTSGDGMTPSAGSSSPPCVHNSQNSTSPSLISARILSENKDSSSGRVLPPSLDRLPSYEEAAAAMRQMDNDTQFADTAL